MVTREPVDKEELTIKQPNNSSPSLYMEQEMPNPGVFMSMVDDSVQSQEDETFRQDGFQGCLSLAERPHQCSWVQADSGGAREACLITGQWWSLHGRRDDTSSR